MSEMTSHERFKRIYNHQEPDRIPIIDSPWSSTIERWHQEGMPEDTNFTEFFGLDKVANISADNSPRYQTKIIEETEKYKIYTTNWGATLKQWKHSGSTPEFLDFTITDKDKWLEAKKRMKPDPDRIPWDHLQKHYSTWKQKGYWITAGLWFGFDITHSWTVGTEKILMALVEDPEWCQDMFETQLELDLQLLEMIWEEGYKFDCIGWPDDMGYKHSQFFSVDTYREILKPFHKKAIDWAHEKGIKANLHSCGDVNPFVPELVECGLDALNPLEVKAGMDPIELKQKYGDKLTFQGGINALLYKDIEAMEKEIKKVVPVMKENGGYIFSTDHSVPDSVSLEEFKHIVELAKKIGSY